MNERAGVLEIAKASGASVLFALIFVLIFAGAIKLFSLSYEVITPINQAIKVISLIAATLLFVRENGGLVKGAIIGAAFFICTYLIFSMMGGFSFSYKTALELLFCVIVGGIGGALSVNIFK